MLTDRISPQTAIFVENVSEELVLDVARRLRAAHELAIAHVSQMSKGAARDLYGHERRANAETALLQLGTTYAPYGVTAREGKNGPTENGPASHVEIVSGNVLMVFHAVESEGEAVRHAAYRDTLVESPQSHFAFLEVEELAPPTLIVAAVLYGPRSAYPEAGTGVGPGFVVVRFPQRDWTYGDGRLDLLGRLLAHEKGERYENGPQLKPLSEMA